MDLLEEIYNETSLKNSERLQLNKLVLRILSENTEPAEKQILQSTTLDKKATYIKVFQRAMGDDDASGVISDRATFKEQLATLLWSYEKPGGQAKYAIPFPYFQVPRTKEALDALISSVYPFACKFSPEEIDEDMYGEPYKNEDFDLESVNTSSSYYDCLVHSFLTSMSKCYRQLSKNQRTAFAYYFRRMICPRYLEISDMMHTALYEQRATLSPNPPNYTEHVKISKVLGDIKNNKALQTMDGALKPFVVKGLEEILHGIENETLARNFIKEQSFLEDRHASLLSNAFAVNILMVNDIRGILTIALFSPLIKTAKHTIVFYNPGDGHFRAVRRITDSTFYFENSELEAFQQEETAKLAAFAPTKTRCPFAIGEVVIHKALEKTVEETFWAEREDNQGFMNCAFIRFVGETSRTPIAEIAKKLTIGGKRTTRKQRRIFLKT